MKMQERIKLHLGMRILEAFCKLISTRNKYVLIDYDYSLLIYSLPSQVLF